MIALTREEHRQRVLRALGVTPYRLRARFGAGWKDRPTVALTAGARPPGICVLVLPARCTTRQRALLDRAMQALGPGFAQAARIDVADGALSAPPPDAAAYFVFGAAQAQALSRSVPADVARAAPIVRLDMPEDLFQGRGKRALWQAAAQLRRHWRGREA